MYNLFDISMTLDLGEVSDREEAVKMLFENDMSAGILRGFNRGEYLEERIECPADSNDFIEWLFNGRREDAWELYANYARTVTKEAGI